MSINSKFNSSKKKQILIIRTKISICRKVKRKEVKRNQLTM